MTEPEMCEVVGGWFALGDGFAVFGQTPEEARQEYVEALQRHAEIMARPADWRDTLHPALQSGKE